VRNLFQKIFLDSDIDQKGFVRSFQLREILKMVGRYQMRGFQLWYVLTGIQLFQIKYIWQRIQPAWLITIWSYSCVVSLSYVIHQDIKINNLFSGYTVSNQTFQTLVMRYGDPDGRLNFQDFLQCLVRLNNMFGKLTI